MKPGKATLESMIEHVLNYGTSSAKDLGRHRLNHALSTVGQYSATETRARVKALLVEHRELRRAARRLAKMAAKGLHELAVLREEAVAFAVHIAVLEGAADVPNWEDGPLPEDDKIDAAFPTRSGRHDLYAEACRLVGARRSKAGLVSLVNWLLHRATGHPETGGFSHPRCVLCPNPARRLSSAFCSEACFKDYQRVEPIEAAVVRPTSPSIPEVGDTVRIHNGGGSGRILSFGCRVQSDQGGPPMYVQSGQFVVESKARG